VDLEEAKTNGNSEFMPSRIELYSRLAKLKHYNHPLHPHFWTYNLLNGKGSSVEENYLDMIKKYKLLN
jgi:hypothetical protein